MSYKCEMCGEQTPKGQAVRRVVTVVRTKPKGGHEVAQEEKVCATCEKKWEGKEPKVIQGENVERATREQIHHGLKRFGQRRA